MKTETGDQAVVFCDSRIICCGFIRNGKYIGSVDGSPFYFMKQIPEFEELELTILDAEIQYDIPAWMVRDALEHIADMKANYDEFIAWEKMVEAEKYKAKVWSVIAGVGALAAAVGALLWGKI